MDNDRLWSGNLFRSIDKKHGTSLRCGGLPVKGLERCQNDVFFYDEDRRKIVCSKCQNGYSNHHIFVNAHRDLVFLSNHELIKESLNASIG